MIGPIWIDRARAYIGTQEIHGPHHSARVVGWWEKIGAPFRDDETSWCGAFVGGVLVESGLPIVKGGAAARAWMKLKQELNRPAVGAVVVFWRGSKSGWSGHVGFVVGKDKIGNLMVLGGNQDDMVSIKPFAMTGPNARILGFYWPGEGTPDASRFVLPVLNSDGRLSTNEA